MYNNLFMMKFILIFLLSFLFSEPTFVVSTNNNPYPGKIFIHAMSGAGSDDYMTILDENLDFYWLIMNQSRGMDFKLNNSKLTYFHNPNEQLSEPFWIVADHTMAEIDSVICSSGMTDFHDIVITDNNTYIVQSYDKQIVDFSSIGGDEYTLINEILRIQEFDSSNNLIFDWFAYDHLNINDYISDTDLILQSPVNQIIWMHGNSIDVDFDNNLILSNRKSSEVIKIHRTTGEIIWIMGGPLNEFQFLEDPLNGFEMQHDVTRIGNGNIIVFDNRSIANLGARSRVAEYAIDELNKTATLVWEFYHPDGYVARAMGSAQRLPNQNTFINWGVAQAQGQHIGASIMEVDYEGNIVLELKFDNYQAYKATKSNFEFSIPMQIGDINLDNILNVQDIICAINYILSNNDTHSIFNLYKIDTNLDQTINIIDIIDIINRVLD